MSARAGAQERRRAPAPFLLALRSYELWRIVVWAEEVIEREGVRNVRRAVAKGSADMTGANRSQTQQTTSGLRCQFVLTPAQPA